MDTRPGLAGINLKEGLQESYPTLVPKIRDTWKPILRCITGLMLAFALPAIALPATEVTANQEQTSDAGDLAQMKRLLLTQQHEIEEMREVLAKQAMALEELRTMFGRPSPPGAGEALNTVPGVVASDTGAQLQSGAPAGQVTGAVPAPSSSSDSKILNDNSNTLFGRRLEDALRGIGGFRFSGDFIYLFDAQARAGNSIAPPLQNLRSRYRVRLNVDKNLNEKVQFHLQLSTGHLNNQVTVLQDFGGIAPKSPFEIAEAWIAFQPSRNFSFRVGRMEETYMDGSRYLIDENVRLNGFEQAIQLPLGGARGVFSGLFNRLELRAGEYILTNPNVVSVPANSPYIAAGYPQGSHVGAANLFHPGVTLRGSLNDNWRHRLTATMQIYRNVNQIQLASTVAGIPTLSDAIGVVLSSPLTGSGNATTTPGGAIYAAPHFRVAHASYRLETSSLLRIGGKPVPGFLELQASRNVGARKLRDGVMASASLGEVRKFGDVRGLYQFVIKDANSMVSQLTDDDLGTGTGVNLAVHAIRVDVGLARFLQWQNILYIQHEKSASNPAENFYVTLQRGASPTFRYFGQLVFVF